MISFDASPRTRLVICGVVLALLAIVAAPLLGPWWIGFLLAGPAIAGYFAARIDWPLHATGLSLTPWLAVLLPAVSGVGAADSGPDGLSGLLLLPFAALLAFAGGFVGAWTGAKTHGGGVTFVPPDADQVRRSAIGGGMLLVALAITGSTRCSGSIADDACLGMLAIVGAGGAVIGAVALRAWPWAAMATAAAFIWGMISWIIGGMTAGGSMRASLLATFVGLIALAALAWAKLATETILLLRERRRIGETARRKI